MTNSGVFERTQVKKKVVAMINRRYPRNFLLAVAVVLASACATTGIAVSKNDGNGITHAVKIDFNKPALDNARAFCSASRTEVFYSAAQKYFYVKLTKTELKKRLGLELIDQVVPRAGNSTSVDIHFYGIKDMKGLKPELRPLVISLRVENDPKFEIYDDAVPLSSSEKKKAAADASGNVSQRMISECARQPQSRHVVALEDAGGEIGGYVFQPSVMDAPVFYYDRNGNPLTVFHIFAPDAEKEKASKIIQQLRAQYPIEHPL
jgi:hypothetical protein